jgi:hypothetical protein
MGAYNKGARLSLRDVQDLNTASESLAAAADTIKAMHPQWAPGIISLMIQANDIVVRVQNKGAAQFARYYAKKAAQDAGQGELEGAPAAAEPAMVAAVPGEN